MGKADRVCEMIKVSNREKKKQQLALPSGLYQFDYFSQMNSEYTEALELDSLQVKGTGADFCVHCNKSRLDAASNRSTRNKTIVPTGASEIRTCLTPISG